MNATVVKKTQDTLGKVIKKPPLTEKLLSKPPFRYLHDIFSEIIRTTGFMKGLYEENDMKSDNVKDKDSKIAFLQKAIDVVMLVSGEPLVAKPARIVAGHEPEKTNELLQAMAKCCINKMSSDDAVKRVLAGEKVDIKTKASTSRSQDKENREGREHHLDREEKKKITERSGSRDQKDPDQPKEQESRRRDGEKDHHRDRERSDKHHRREQDHHDKDKSRERDKDKDKGRVKDRDREKDRERNQERDKDKERDKGREKTRDRDSRRDRERDKEKRRDKEREKDRERHKEGEERKKSGESGNSKARVSEEPQQKPNPEPSKTAKHVPAEPNPDYKPAEVVENQPDSPARIPRPSSAKGQRRRPKIGGQDESDSEGEGDALLAQRPSPQEHGDIAGSSVPSDMASSNRRIPRPSSARPAPPRVKKQESYSDVTPAERLSSAKPSAPVIMDGKMLSEDEEDEDEQFLVEVPPPSDSPEMDVGLAQELNSENKHGGLVKRILETKKDYELSPSSPKSKEQNVVSEAARKKERDMVTREIDRLRSSIQTVCRSTLPLGKIMDYIQEDMDAMQAELRTWRRENKEHAQALLQEQRATDRAVEPLKLELAELEQLIKDQQDKICAVRSNILKNEEKIQKMVTGINFSART
ncbi:TRAF3-interacting protein 1 isoform X3 [Etheostoma spectabile]|uniref:TRAF3-interacting protein 1 isoform X3 n=1 Tax=Etheostoma spectabile TaxID=54343 RepID=UPI0013AEF747|nr:TRAF3-interacting protein 1 isoform X3 [Etheostoma spectabile]